MHSDDPHEAWLGLLLMVLLLVILPVIIGGVR